MNEEEYGLLLGGMIRTIVTNKHFYKRASYSYDKAGLTEAGKHAVIEIMNLWAPVIHASIHQADEVRARELVLNELKKE